MRNLFKKSLTLKIRNKFKYPGLGIHETANLNVCGDLIYGNGCGIGEGANLIIPENASLALGDDCYIGRYVELGPSGKIEIGSQSSIQDRCIFVGDVSIGRYCLFSLNVLISSGRHYFDLSPTWLIKDQDNLIASNKKMAQLHSKPVVIEDDCWLGINVVVMSGVTIGKGAIIGANSVVTKDVEPYTVVAGIPAKPLKKRLNFRPPTSINYASSDDWPYFYSGFELSQYALKKYAEYGGVAARKEFVICLNASEGNSIHLRIRNLGSPESTLIFQGAVMKILHEMQDISFPIDDTTKTRFHFIVLSDSENAFCIVERAWIQ